MDNNEVKAVETVNVKKTDLAEFAAEVICKAALNVVVGLKDLDVSPDAIADAFSKKLLGKVKEVKANTEKVFG